MEKVAVLAGHKVMVVVVITSGLIVGDPREIITQQPRPHLAHLI